MKVKSLYKWQMMNLQKSVLIFYGIIYAIYALGFVITKLEGGDVQISGTDFSSLIYVFVLSLAMFGETFKFILCNGVSRKTMLYTQILISFTVSVIMTVIDAFNLWAFGSLLGIQNTSMVRIFYQNAPVWQIMLISFFVYFAFSLFGFFIASLNSRLSKQGKFIFYIGSGALLLVGLPFVVSVLPKNAMQVLSNFFSIVFEFIAKSPFNAMALIGVSSILLYAISFLLVRKSNLKTV